MAAAPRREADRVAGECVGAQAGVAEWMAGRTRGRKVGGAVRVQQLERAVVARVHAVLLDEVEGMLVA